MLQKSAEEQSLTRQKCTGSEGQKYTHTKSPQQPFCEYTIIMLTRYQTRHHYGEQTRILAWLTHEDYRLYYSSSVCTN